MAQETNRRWAKKALAVLGLLGAIGYTHYQLTKPNKPIGFKGQQTLQELFNHKPTNHIIVHGRYPEAGQPPRGDSAAYKDNDGVVHIGVGDYRGINSEEIILPLSSEPKVKGKGLEDKLYFSMDRTYDGRVYLNGINTKYLKENDPLLKLSKKPDTLIRIFDRLNYESMHSHGKSLFD